MTPERSAFLRGLRHSLPFVITAVPFALLWGVVASEAGLNLFEVAAFSVVAFAGASQFAALQLMQDQAPLVVILATALAVNLRLLMYSVALAPHLGEAPLRVRAVLAHFVVDQSFALAQAEYERRPGMGLNAKVAYFAGGIVPVATLWFIMSGVGAVLGHALPPEYALDFAVPITFLAMFAPMLRSVAHVAAACLSVGATLALGFLPFGTGLLVAAALAMAVGAGLDVWQERRAT